MSTPASLIKDNILNKNLAPIYVLEGTETLPIDELVKLFEEKALDDSEKDFNQSIIYGGETDANQVITEAMRMPMFGDRILIILKEAQQMKDFAELHTYLDKPNPNTTLVIEYKGKKIDTRIAFAKKMSKAATHFLSEKLKDNEIPSWIMQYGKQLQIEIDFQTAELLALFLGNDQPKIKNELEKIKISEPNISQLNNAIIEKYIGISKDYNPFEAAEIILGENLDKKARLVNYINTHPKDMVLILLTIGIHSFLSKALLCQYAPNNDFATNRKLGIFPQHRAFFEKYKIKKIHQLIVINNSYNEMSVGLGASPGISDYELIKELMVKFQFILTK